MDCGVSCNIVWSKLRFQGELSGNLSSECRVIQEEMVAYIILIKPICEADFTQFSFSGKFGIICMEDLIHEIYTVGPNFKQAANFLWPFKLNTPTGGWRRKYNHFNDGGDFGCREEQINPLLKRMI